MGKRIRTDVYRKACICITEQGDLSINSIIGNSHKIGLPQVQTRQDAINIACMQYDHLIEYERQNPGSIPFKAIAV